MHTLVAPAVYLRHKHIANLELIVEYDNGYYDVGNLASLEILLVIIYWLCIMYAHFLLYFPSSNPSTEAVLGAALGLLLSISRFVVNFLQVKSAG